MEDQMWISVNTTLRFVSYKQLLYLWICFFQEKEEKRRAKRWILFKVFLLLFVKEIKQSFKIINRLIW